MDKTTLVAADLHAGRHIVLDLEGRGIIIEVAAWLQDEESGSWQLILSSPALTRPGSKRAYTELVSVLRRYADMDTDNVLLLSPNDGIVRDLKRRIRTNAELQDIHLDSLYLGNRSYRAAHIYRVMDGHRDTERMDFGARVRVRSTGQLGTVHGMVPTSPPRYLVLYDVNEANGQSSETYMQSPAGYEYTADELEVLYVVKSGGWPERNPDWLVAATSSHGPQKTSVTFRQLPR